MKERNFLKLEVRPDEKARFEGYCRREKISQLDAGTTLFSWFLRQDEVLQDLVMGRVKPPLVAAAERHLIETLAAKKAEKPTSAKSSAI